MDDHHDHDDDDDDDDDETHDGSMVLVYMLTWLGYIDGKCYHV